MNPEQNYSDIRDAVQKLCMQFPNEYWCKLDRSAEYPTELVQALITDAQDNLRPVLALGEHTDAIRTEFFS